MSVKKVTAKLSSLLLCGLLAGVIVAVAVFPISAAAGLGVKYAGDSFRDLPSDLKIPASEQATEVYANDGKTLITTFYDENRKNVTLAEIAPVMRQAVVAAEDSRFFEHGGVDVKSILRSLVANAQGGQVEQGASTLTMQYVRNVLKDDPNLSTQQRLDATADTTSRKVQEMRYAIALEQKLSKSEILNRYLNIAYFGDGAYGVYAASEAYFSVPPSQLTLAQAALLAGLVQSPEAYNPLSGGEKAATQRRGYVLDSLVKMKAVTAADAATAKAQPLALHPSQTPNDCAQIDAAHNSWGFLCDYLRQWWDAQPSFGKTVQDRENTLEQGGYKIVTSLNPAIQAKAVQESLNVYGYNNPRALPMAVVEPGTGHVLALAVNRHYSLAANPNGQHTFPNTVDNLVAGGPGAYGYQTGSTFKLFTMLAALQAGKTLSTSFNAPSPLVTKWQTEGADGCGGYYCPVNDNPSWMDGHRTMWDGYGRSVNTYWVWMEEQIGPQNAVAMAQKLGIRFRAQADQQMANAQASTWGAFTLGVVDVTPLDLANAYATIADDGTYCAPLPVLSITDATGHAVPAAQPSCHRAVSQDIARAAVDAARCPVGQQSHFGMCNGGTAPDIGNMFGDRPVGGKTGSSEENATESFVGFTPTLAAAATACDPDDPQDAVGAGISEAVDDAVGNTMVAALRGTPYRSFQAPSETIAFGAGGRSKSQDNGNDNRNGTNGNNHGTSNGTGNGNGNTPPTTPPRTFPPPKLPTPGPPTRSPGPPNR
jgi:membrane peptidoglycan carboxypeptidase